MRIAIIDADLIGRKKHRFPNLVCMKISGYHKECGDEVILKTDYDGLHEYDKVFLSKYNQSFFFDLKGLNYITID